MERLRGRNSERTRLAVLDAAERLFANRGFAATSMRDLAEASGVSQPLIHHHFGRKEDLYSAVKQRVVERIGSMLPSAGNRGTAGEGPRAAEGGHARKELDQILRVLFRFCRENPRLLRLMSWARLEDEASLWPGEEELIQRFREFGARHQQTGEMRRDIDVVMVVAIVENLITSWWENRKWMQRLFPDRDGDALDALFLDHISKILIEGVTS